MNVSVQENANANLCGTHKHPCQCKCNSYWSSVRYAIPHILINISPNVVDCNIHGFIFDFIFDLNTNCNMYAIYVCLLSLNICIYFQFVTSDSLAFLTDVTPLHGFYLPLLVFFAIPLFSPFSAPALLDHFFLSFPLTLIFLSAAYSPLSLHQGRNNWRSAFQWKPLINTNLHLKCNLILTTYALSLNWISHLKDEGGLCWRYCNIQS